MFMVQGSQHNSESPWHAMTRITMDMCRSLDVIAPPDAYYAAHIPAARAELTRHKLAFDPATGIVYESGRWLERPADSATWTPEDAAFYSDIGQAWEWFLSRHVRARAARLHNRELAQ